jgi:hypothetical protein
MCKRTIQKPLFLIFYDFFTKFNFFLACSKNALIKSYKCHHAKNFKHSFHNMLSNQNQVPNKHIMNHWTVCDFLDYENSKNATNTYSSDILKLNPCKQIFKFIYTMTTILWKWSRDIRWAYNLPKLGDFT